MLGLGEDPVAWSFPLVRLGATRLRVHWFVPLWVGAELLAWLPEHALGLAHVVAVVGALMLLAVIREGARVGVARWLGSEADTTAVWPLGGLTPVSVLGTPRPLLADLGGLLAGLCLLPVLAWACVKVGCVAEALAPDLLLPRVTAATLRTPEQVAVWWVYYATMLQIAANLVPAGPFDAGRAVGALARGRLGSRGALVAARIGLLASAGLFVYGCAAGETRLILVAAFAGFVTFMDFRRQEFLAAPSLVAEAPARPPPVVHRPSAESRAEPSLDEVLGKISRLGMASLTPGEREVLARETDRRRRP
ncbi:MAG: hypothetical protein DYG92_04480 [Leptolyngbya sp. PLA1]|nr:hypothetical protein [Leptolyngbya sp. PLA1]